MTEDKIQVDINLLKYDVLEVRKSSKLNFKELFKGKKDIYEISVIKGDTGYFTRLWGLNINPENGNIALSLVPNIHEYVCIGNFYDELAKNVFHSKNLPEDIDRKYFLEILKLVEVEKVETAIEKYLTSPKQEEVSSNSIILRLVEKMKESKVELPDFDRKELVNGLIDMKTSFGKRFSAIYRLFLDFYFLKPNNSIRYPKSSRDSRGYVKTVDFIRSGSSNLEATNYWAYKYNIPRILLESLLSYLRIDFNTYLEIGNNSYLEKDNSIVMSPFLTDKELAKSYRIYSFLDVLDARGILEEVEVRFELAKEYKKTKELADFLKDSGILYHLEKVNISLQDFLSCLKKYIIYKGTLYKRDIPEYSSTPFNFISQLLEVEKSVENGIIPELAKVFV